MRLDLLEELAPVCPRCLHGAESVSARVVTAETAEIRAGHLWHGVLHCSNPECWMEFPVIDGVPILVPDPLAYVAGARAQILARQDMPPVLESIVGDAAGPGSDFDTTRQHLGLYAWSHYADWSDPGGDSQIPAILDVAFSKIDGATGAAIDLGCSVGRGAWEVARRTERTVLGCDLNFSMLRLAQKLMLEGTADFPRRRIGLVYDPITISLPSGLTNVGVDFWAADSMAMPFDAGSFGLASALNLIDCIAGPTNMLAEASRLLVPGGVAIFSTPYDWSANATEPPAWIGGHSQRGPHSGAAEPVLRATLEQCGLTSRYENPSVPWKLRLHERSTMHYDLHLIVGRKKGSS